MKTKRIGKKVYTRWCTRCNKLFKGKKSSRVCPKCIKKPNLKEKQKKNIEKKNMKKIINSLKNKKKKTKPKYLSQSNGETEKNTNKGIATKNY